MFGLFKRKSAPAGPVVIAGEVEIACPARDVYALIDWADARNAKLATGNEIRAVEGKSNRFDLIMSMMPDLTFELLVTDAEPHSRYAFGCVIEPPLGNMDHSHESYSFEELGENRCQVVLTTSTTFVDGLSEREYVAEVATMAASVQSALQKLKLQAEHGADFAKAIEGNTLL